MDALSPVLHTLQGICVEYLRTVGVTVKTFRTEPKVAVMRWWQRDTKTFGQVRWMPG